MSLEIRDIDQEDDISILEIIRNWHISEYEDKLPEHQRTLIYCVKRILELEARLARLEEV